MQYGLWSITTIGGRAAIMPLELRGARETKLAQTEKEALALRFEKTGEYRVPAPGEFFLTRPGVKYAAQVVCWKPLEGLIDPEAWEHEIVTLVTPLIEEVQYTGYTGDTL